MFGAIPLQLFHMRRDHGSAVVGGLLDTQPESAPFRWQTCLRLVELRPRDNDAEQALAEQAGVELLHEERAYKRLLELICGLHSPLVGETEVFGQFKQAARDALEQTHAADPVVLSTLQQWFEALIQDAKLIRQKHLRDLGSQSYGSLVRREVRRFLRPQVDVLGAGILAREILPWLLKERATSVSLSARSLEKAHAATAALAQPEKVETREIAAGASLIDDARPRILVVAAPMSTDEIRAWMGVASYTLIIDLRGESREDSLTKLNLENVEILALDEIFRTLDRARGEAAARKEQAMRAIEELVAQRLQELKAHATHRPFGWDDVCS